MLLRMIHFDNGDIPQSLVIFIIRILITKVLYVKMGLHHSFQ